MPPVLTRVDDALWVAVLSLLALQMSFLLPPLGYAVMMSGARIVPHPTLRQLVRALTPYLLGLAVVLALVLAQPKLRLASLTSRRCAANISSYPG